MKEILRNITEEELGENKEIKKISKKLILGDSVTMDCFVIKKVTNMGRSMVIDVNKPRGLNIRKIDHRSI